ncbi:MAG: hypothetical protein ACTSP1_19930 [Candidatus Freyarchaeota archaeon]
MCAITGFAVYDRATFKRQFRQVIAKFVATWVASEVRGGDASGFFIVNKNGGGKVVKASCPPWELVDEIDFTYLLKSIGIIAHTRAATAGSPKNNGNNHPLKVGDVCGVHNGVLFEYQYLQLLLNCQNDVDSEVLIALLDRADNDIDGLEDILYEVSGSMALAWARKGCPWISLFSDGINKLSIIPDLENGVVFFASEYDWVAGDLPHYTLESDCYLRLREGQVVRYLLPDVLGSVTSVPTGVSAWQDIVV